ncbi:glycosyltransferase [Zunongwangia endophytica]|uniref:Glycosyltransferase n=1 Tax=Zunongwangia endophytica TaxID=1808945 RepID=A0ABV8H7R5_9FLAO|nr:glycosyltransferase [Zunongwangia endophytica]MDN3596203.1 glycosyltransferase [Zunongwangia endophytica]
MHKGRILVAALNWGLGHAARCIPVIKALLKNDFEPILASDGDALKLLQKEFPHIICVSLPSYNIEYSKTPENLKWKLLFDSPRILKTIKAEKKATKIIVKEYGIIGIISDNRWGVRRKKLKSIFITHQLNVLSGSTTYFSSKIQQKYIEKFDECWVPDYPGPKNLSGILGHLKTENSAIKYIGPLSRIEKRTWPKIYDYLIILSGPEPQRSFLEQRLLKVFEKTENKILFIRGVFSTEEISSKNANINIRNNLYGAVLQQALNSCNVVIARSGYTTIMDLNKIEAKAFFIPTPGQFEQEYLAERLQKLVIAPFCTQDDFSLEKLNDLEEFSGFRSIHFDHSFRDLFALFERK